jgi:50S ribosome-binding GTPase
MHQPFYAYQLPISGRRRLPNGAFLRYYGAISVAAALLCLLRRKKKTSQLTILIGRRFASSPFIVLSLFYCSKVPAYLNVVDIAGLVKGAAEGQGLGNAFLSHISACDGIFHLCREY